VKTTFLELLMQFEDQQKNNPLSTEQRIELTKVLLNKEVKQFDFSILNCPGEVYETEEDTINFWNRIFDDIWSVLAAKCPKLLEIVDWRSYLPSCVTKIIDPELNGKVFSFKNLRSLKTNCTIDSGKN